MWRRKGTWVLRVLMEESEDESPKRSSQLTYEDIAQACGENPKLLEQLISQNMSMFEDVLRKTRQEQRMVSYMSLDRASFSLSGFTQSAKIGFRDVIGSVLRDFVVDDSTRLKLLTTPETSKRAKDLLTSLHSFDEFQDFFQIAFDEASQLYSDKFESVFVERYFTTFDDETKKFKVLPLEDEHSEGVAEDAEDAEDESAIFPNVENQLTQPPSKEHRKSVVSTPGKSPRPSIRLSSPRQKQQRFLLSSEEEEEEEMEEDFVQENDVEEEVGTEHEDEDDEETPTVPRDTSKKKRKVDSISMQSLDDVSITIPKKKRGRPRNGPSMNLEQGTIVLAKLADNNEWKPLRIDRRSTSETITKTKAKALLSAGCLMPFVGPESQFVDV